jgi:hypothetical protein
MQENGIRQTVIHTETTIAPKISATIPNITHNGINIIMMTTHHGIAETTVSFVTKITNPDINQITEYNPVIFVFLSMDTIISNITNYQPD